MEGLAGKTVLLVTHQVDFLPAFDSVLVIFSILKDINHVNSHFFSPLINHFRFVVSIQKFCFLFVQSYE